jgi:SAM-dependent methyltransferase
MKPQVSTSAFRAKQKCVANSSKAWRTEALVLARYLSARIARMLDWRDDVHFVLGDTTFSTIPYRASADQIATALKEASEDTGSLFVFKPRWRIDHYVELLERLKPARIFELGIFLGGSAALFAELARPERLVAIDNRPRAPRMLTDYLGRRGLSDLVSTYYDVDQADRARLVKIAGDAFGGEAIDLVIDDCSHRYAPTRASFSVLFPLLRPGGVYVIEDWPWAHTPVGAKNVDGLIPDRVPLTRLIFELILAIPGVPGLIESIEIDANAVQLTRGDTLADPSTFDLSKCLNARDMRLLTQHQALVADQEGNGR